MTDEQFEKCKQNNIAIYSIWIKGSKFHKKKCDYEEFEQSWIGRQWINESIPYDTKLGCDFMYVTEDKLQQGKRKLYNYLEKQQLYILEKAKKKLQVLRTLKEENK